MTPTEVPSELIDLGERVWLDRVGIAAAPRGHLAALLASVLPAHEAMVRAKAAAEQAEWLPEILHCVWGFAMREHEGFAQLMPGHAEEALRHVPGHVLDAAVIARGEASADPLPSQP